MKPKYTLLFSALVKQNSESSPQVPLIHPPLSTEVMCALYIHATNSNIRRRRPYLRRRRKATSKSTRISGYRQRCIRYMVSHLLMEPVKPEESNYVQDTFSIQWKIFMSLMALFIVLIHENDVRIFRDSHYMVKYIQSLYNAGSI